MKKISRKSLCEKNLQFLSYIHSLPVKKRNRIIKLTATQNEINSIVEIFINFLNNNLNCGKKFIQSMKKYSNYFDKIIKKSQSIKKKIYMLSSKKGGFLLQSLLALAVPFFKKIFLQ